LGPASQSIACVGVGGTLGAILAERLGAVGVEVRCPDPTDDRTVPELESADVVVNASGPRGRPGLVWEDYFREHLGVTSTVVRSMRPGARLVQISSVAVWGAQRARIGPESPMAPTLFPAKAYACAKLLAESMAHVSGAARGIAVRVLRPSIVYGPGVESALDTLRRMHARGVRLRLTPARVRQQLLHIDFFVHAVERAVTVPIAPDETALALADPFVLTNADLAPPPGRWPNVDIDVLAAAAAHRRWSRTVGIPPLSMEALAILGIDNEFDVEPTLRTLGIDAARFSRALTFDPYWRG
jgi:nucleoside-diphosphate-sugar epimerase